jgi:hypothetical protein
LQLEYSALRTEILHRIELRQKLIEVTLTIASAFLGIGFAQSIKLIPTAGGHTSPILSLIYPPIATCLALGWFQLDSRIREISDHISDKIEPLIPCLTWETSRREKRKEKTNKPIRATKTTIFQNLWVKLASWRITTMSHGGVFVLTQVMALLIGLSEFTPELPRPPITFHTKVLISVDFLAIFVVLILIVASTQTPKDVERDHAATAGEE